MSGSPSGELLKHRNRDVAEQIDDAKEPAPEIPNPDGAKVSDLTAYCRLVGEWPKDWKKLKADGKRQAFKAKFLPDEARTDTFDPNDPIHQAAHFVENVEADDLPGCLRGIADDTGAGRLKLGGLLSIVASRSLYTSWGHETFKDWVASDTEFEKSKAYALVKAYNQVMDLGLPYSAFDGIGWTKLYAILPVVTVENRELWVERAKALDTGSLLKEVREARRQAGPEDDGKGTSGSPGPTTKQKGFRLHEDQYETVQAALDQMMEELPTEHENVALEHICAAKLSGEIGGGTGADPGKLTAEQCVGQIIRFFRQLRELAGGDDMAVWQQAIEPIEALFPDVEIVVNVGS